MILDLCEEAVDFGRSAHRAVDAAGGDELARRAEADPTKREDLVGPVLEGIGAWQVDPRGSPEELEAAAALCRSAGYWALPYPVAERLSRPGDADADGLLVVAGPTPAAPVSGLGLRWAAVTLDGRRATAVPRDPAGPVRKTAFVTGLDLEFDGHLPERDVAIGLALPCWTLLGMLDRAVDLTRTYVQERRQFGQPLSSFQGVQFQLTDAEVERLGVEELAKYSLWSIESDGGDAVTDALALRAAAIEAADCVFRVAHQLHGAIGFCDETTLSWLSRYSVPLRRLPLGLSATRGEVTQRLGRRGLAGLFGADA